MKKYNKYLLMILFVCFSCKKDYSIHEKSNNVVYEKSNKNNTQTILLQKAINSGDFDAYNKVSSYYIIEDKSLEFYYYAQLMAFKYDCPEAYYHLFSIMNDDLKVNGVETYSVDPKFKKMKNYYLLKSYELGWEQSKDLVIKEFGGIQKIPNSKLFSDIESNVQN